MLSTWQLSWNEKSYKATERMLAAAASEEGKHMVQSWGNSSVKNINKIKSGDTVYISCNKKCIGKAIIVQPFKNNTGFSYPHPYSVWFTILQLSFSPG